MKKVFYQNDCDLNLLKGKKVAIIGYGSQGHAHALNLHESGVSVVVGLFAGHPEWDEVKAKGLEVALTADAAKMADIVMILVPDQLQKEIYENDIEPNLKKGGYLAFAHGFNIHYGQIVPRDDMNVFMIAPKGPGHTVRSEFEKGRGVPGLTAVYQDATGDTLNIALAYGLGVGCGRAGILQTEFKEETETDLFGEQAVLCGGATALMQAGFEVLVEAGYDPRIAYFECIHEMKLIIDMIEQGGFARMRYSVSDTAEYGDYKIGPRIITEETKKEMRKVLKEVQDGSFAKDFILENKAGLPHLHACRRIGAAHPLEEVGEELRSMYSWNKK